MILIRASKKQQNILAAAVIMLVVLCFGIIVSYRIAGFRYGSGDTAVAEQAIWNTVHGDWFYQSFLPASTNFREHLNFSQFLFLLPYAVIPQLITLYAVILIFYAAAAWMLFRFVRDRSGAFMAAFICAIFILQPVTILQLIGTLHIAAIGAPLLCITLIYYEEKKYLQWMAFLLLTTLTSEFIAPTIILLGVLAFIDSDRRSWKWCAPPLLAGGVMLLAAQWYITIGYAKTEELVKAVQNITHGIPAKRLQVIEGLFRPVAYLLPFFSRYILLMLPTLVLALFVIQEGRLNIGSHLLSLTSPIIAFSVWDVMRRIKNRRAKIVTATIICIGILASIPLWIPSASIESSPRAGVMRKAVSLVRDDGSVTASRSISYHLARRHDFYLIDNQQLTDYIVIDMSQYEFKEKRYREYIRSISDSGVYVKVMQEKNMLIYIKKQKLSELLQMDEKQLPKKDSILQERLLHSKR